jgi:hypothetical protein
MSTQLAAQLIRSHHLRISQAIARQLQRTVPRYRQVDASVLERNIATIMGGVQQLLEHGSEERLLRIVADVAQLRQMSGFKLPEFLVASLCFLPVIRRFLIERSGDLQEGLARYEAVEAIALPLMGRVATIFMDAAEDTQPNSETAFLLAGEKGRPRAAVPMPFEIEAVTGDEQVELRRPRR